ncbi:hypothetical protein BHE74_00055017 [Ensete ventricosum]|uniref:Uncharacterized protein n=1 Tax=Ensete ventricosum TaxID=4639 RepID=A0A426Y0G2_ENSVE|nr:hypothetical protein B296_00051822 [Ensete ventricosum]RWV91168.1 hypothetical protein GW17_00046565 [Ensete ventricosum]RWW39637.1 hypothetical protein BHE74_00055017 [Ensete ventricosum]RZS23696.1 hypothetical protein BHM03_00056672 [Ensete ventricosum]
MSQFERRVLPSDLFSSVILLLFDSVRGRIPRIPTLPLLLYCLSRHSAAAIVSWRSGCLSGFVVNECCDLLAVLPGLVVSRWDFLNLFFPSSYFYGFKGSDCRFVVDEG